MKPDVNFILSIWKDHTKSGEYVFLSTKNNSGAWHDHPIKYNPDTIEKEVETIIDTFPSKSHDLYWCPLPFRKDRRLKENAIRSKYLFQDMDYISEKEVEKELKPTQYWESSPDRFHGLWKLKRAHRIKQMIGINKALAYHSGFDKGGWDISQVLRVPGSINHKYKEKPEVKLLKNNKKPYDLNTIKGIVGTLNTEPEKDKEKEKMEELNAQEVLKKIRKKVSRKVISLLLSRNAQVGSRSEMIWYLENKLFEAGATKNEVYTLIKNSVWNKYKGRADEETRLLSEIEKILEKGPKDVAEPQNDLPEDNSLSQIDLDDDEELGLSIVSMAQVMKSLDSYPGWLVEGFWSRRSHGIIAGEPKSFKSTFAIDMAVSVASGKPFLGQHKVMEPGPVIYIQNENADYIIKDKMEKIISSRGLGGEATFSADKKSLNVRFPQELPLYFINQQGFLLDDPIHQQIIEKICDEYKPVLMVFDPLYLMFDGDVNSAQELNPVLNWLLKLKNEKKTGIQLIHHYNKGGGKTGPARGGQRMLGSTTLHGWIESAWYLQLDHTKQENPNDEVGKVSEEPARVVMDREFRAAGAFPKIDLFLSMGEYGSPFYEVRSELHSDEGYIKKETVDMDKVETQIISLLQQQDGVIQLARISELIGFSRRVIKLAAEELAAEGKINMTKNGIVLIN